MTEKKKFSKRKNILWVDDDVNKPALEPDRDELGERNCQIIPESRPDNFLKIIKDDNKRIDGFLIDCLLIDTMMPKGNELSLNETSNTTRTGLALIKRLFESGNYGTIPIIVYSVVDEDEIKDFCFENKIPLSRITILNKSISSRDFADKVVEIVEPKRKQTTKANQYEEPQS